MVISVAFAAGPYYSYFIDPGMVRHPYSRNVDRDFWFLIHIPASILWLGSGLTQLAIEPKKYPRLHRANGATYSLLLMVGSLSIFPATFNVQHQTVFGMNSYAFMAFPLISLTLGLFFLYKGEVRRHGAWMIRSTIMPALIPVYRLAAAVGVKPRYYFILTIMGFIGAELFIGGKLEKLLPRYALPLAAILCATSFWLVMEFHFKYLRHP